MLYLTNCRVVDGTGHPALENATVQIDGDRILNVGRREDFGSALEGHGDGAPEVLDLGGATLLPGLWNMHVHLSLTFPFPSRRVAMETPVERGFRCARRAADALKAGVTTIRCVGEWEGVDIDLKNAIAQGWVEGSRIFSAGSALIATGGHWHNALNTVEADGEAGFLRAAREQLRRGADLIKVCITGGIGTPGEHFSSSQMTREELAAAVWVAHEAGKHIAAHAGGDAAIRLAVELGVDTIEHGYSFSQETAERMAAAGTVLVPTLTVTAGEEYYRLMGAPQWHIDNMKAAALVHKESVRRAIQCGVRMAVGTDLLPTDPSGGTIATVHEIELLVELGLSPLDALKAATLEPARVHRVDDRLGTVAPGMIADLIATPGRPDEDVSALRQIQFVMKEGRLVRFDASPGASVAPSRGSRGREM